MMISSLKHYICKIHMYITKMLVPASTGIKNTVNMVWEPYIIVHCYCKRAVVSQQGCEGSAVKEFGLLVACLNPSIAKLPMLDPQTRPLFHKLLSCVLSQM